MMGKYRSMIVGLLVTILGWVAEGNAFATSTSMTSLQKADSLKALQINKQAEDPNFVHAYILDVTPGKAFYSTYGHAAIRLVCPSKKLDYCFSFEMDMVVSSDIDVLTSSAKAGFFMKPTPLFLTSYQKEGRGVTAYELNLTPKEKQALWQFLDKSVADGASWTFDYITVNCLTMVFYAIQSAIVPEKIMFKQLPEMTQLSFGDWQDEVTRQSPWVNLLMHAVLWNANDSRMSAQDKLSPVMLQEALPQAYVTDSLGGNKRSLIKGQAVVLLPEVYHDAPCWFRPWMAGVLLVVLLAGIIAWARKRKKKR